MITDNMVKAACDKFMFGPHDEDTISSMHMALEAAESAAWCDDIGQAPKGANRPKGTGPKILAVMKDWPPGTDPIILWPEIGDMWFSHTRIYYHHEIALWRHLPQPPKAAAQSDLMPVRDDKMEGK